MNGSLSPDNIIQKSRPLLAELKQAKLSVTELKLIEIYLSKINAYWELSSDNSEKERTVKFSSQDLKELFKKKIDISHIKQSLDNIHSIKVRNAFEEGTKSTERTIVLFEKSELTIDDNGISEITLTCSQSAMQYIFDIENLGFLQYKLKNVLYLKSKYSYTLFLYLLDNKFRKSWEIDFDELRELLKTNYTTYAEINKLILKPCLQEIKANTNLNDFLKDYSIAFHGDSVVRTSYFKYLHPKECFIDTMKVNEKFLKTIKSHHLVKARRNPLFASPQACPWSSHTSQSSLRRFLRCQS